MTRAIAAAVFALLAMCLCPGTGQADQMPVQTGSLLYSKTFDDWSVIVLRFNSGVQFRAATVSENVPGAGLIISFDAGSCDTYGVDLVTNSTAANTSDIISGIQIVFRKHPRDTFPCNSRTSRESAFEMGRSPPRPLKPPGSTGGTGSAIRLVVVCVKFCTKVLGCARGLLVSLVHIN